MIQFNEYRRANLRKSSSVLEGIANRFDILEINLNEAIRLPLNLNEGFDGEIANCLVAIAEEDYFVNKSIICEHIQDCKYYFNTFILENIDFAQYLQDKSSMPNASDATEKLKTSLKWAINGFKDHVRKVLEPILSNRPSTGNGPGPSPASNNTSGPAPSTGPNGATPVNFGTPNNASTSSNNVNNTNGPTTSPSHGNSSIPPASAPNGANWSQWWDSSPFFKRSKGFWKVTNPVKSVVYHGGKALGKAWDYLVNGKGLPEHLRSQAISIVENLFEQTSFDVLNQIDGWADELIKYIDQNVDQYVQELPGTLGHASRMPPSMTQNSTGIPGASPRRGGGFPPPKTDEEIKNLLGSGSPYILRFIDTLAKEKGINVPDSDPTAKLKKFNGLRKLYGLPPTNALPKIHKPVTSDEVKDLPSQNLDYFANMTKTKGGTVQLRRIAKFLGMPLKRPKENSTAYHHNLASEIYNKIQELANKGEFPPPGAVMSTTPDPEVVQPRMPTSMTQGSTTAPPVDTKEPEDTTSSSNSFLDDIASKFYDEPAKVDEPKQPEMPKAELPKKNEMSPEARLDWILKGLELEHGKQIDLNDPSTKKWIIHTVKDLIDSGHYDNNDLGNGTIVDELAAKYKKIDPDIILPKSNDQQHVSSDNKGPVQAYVNDEPSSTPPENPDWHSAFSDLMNGKDSASETDSDAHDKAVEAVQGALKILPDDLYNNVSPHILNDMLRHIYDSGTTDPDKMAEKLLQQRKQIELIAKASDSIPKSTKEGIEPGALSKALMQYVKMPAFRISNMTDPNKINEMPAKLAKLVNEHLSKNMLKKKLTPFIEKVKNSIDYDAFKSLYNGDARLADAEIFRVLQTGLAKGSDKDIMNHAIEEIRKQLTDEEPKQNVVGSKSDLDATSQVMVKLGDIKLPGGGEAGSFLQQSHEGPDSEKNIHQEIQKALDANDQDIDKATQYLVHKLSLAQSQAKNNYSDIDDKEWARRQAEEEKEMARQQDRDERKTGRKKLAR